MAKRLLVSFFLTILTVIIEICAVVPLASSNWLLNGDFKCGLMKYCNFSVSSPETCQNLEEKLPSEKGKSLSFFNTWLIYLICK